MTTGVSSITPPNVASVSPAAGFAVRPAHLAALVQQVARKSRTRAIAVRVPGAWTGGDHLVVGDERWTVVRADSVLAVREALADHEEAAPDARLVVLTRLDTQDLGWDVLARIGRQCVHTLEAWELLGDLFRARAVDPRVAKLGWLADALLEHAPPGGYPPAPSGVLDLDTAWQEALYRLLGLESGAPDALTLLRWSARDGVADRWDALAPDSRASIAERLADSAGALGRTLSAALAARQGARLVALGLACDVLWPDAETAATAVARDTTTRDVLTAARVRLEPLVGGAAPPAAVARAWAAQAQRVMAELSVEQAGAQRRAAEAVLEEVRADACVVLSRVLPAAAARRAARFGRAIGAWLGAGGDATAGAIAAAEEARATFVAHVDVSADPARAERATMALRLVRGLASAASEAAPEGAGFGALVTRQVRVGSWVDAARTALLGGDPDGELAAAYAALLRRAREVREVGNQRFAERLVAWNAQPAVEPELVPVERVLEQTVAPVADARSVLVVLADGLDLVVWRQLHADLAARGWTWWRPDTAAAIAPVGVATLPSVTAYSRASLFAGVAKAGSQATEKPDFAAHPALRRSAVSGRVPVLFHKGELGAGNALAADVRRAIGDRQQRVVGAVVNAVDDWLDKSDQVLPRWSVAEVPLLDALLQEAALAGRAVVVLSDHGHLLDHDTTLRGGGTSARWRLPAGGAPAGGEVLATGARVRAVAGQEAVVLVWSEALRYTAKKTGYHGGASPQEVIAPIAVLSRDELGVPNWRPVVDAPPAWWEAAGGAARAAARPSGDTAPMVRAYVAPPAGGPAAPAGATSESAPAPAQAAAPAWVDALLATPVYAAQRALAGRTAPRDEQMRAVLETLDRYQGRAPRAAVAAALGLPEIRVRGVVAGVRRLLNVEGFAVVEEEEATGTLTLNRDLLRVQFALGA